METKRPDLTLELEKIAKKGRVDVNTILVKETTDHKNISLWSRVGKRIGPMHPHNAARALQEFARIGVYLTADMPTADQIAAYKETDEYKAAEKAYQESRAVKDQSRNKGKIEEYLKKIAEMTGQNVAALHNVLKSAVPLSEGQAKLD